MDSEIRFSGQLSNADTLALMGQSRGKPIPGWLLTLLCVAVLGTAATVEFMLEGIPWFSLTVAAAILLGWSVNAFAKAWAWKRVQPKVEPLSGVASEQGIQLE